ncbi:hypothetical protein ACFS27_09110 [Promicromonospora vindobonensis]|uniref:Uncharacterized protein n=1 Tax=Promicromonospora vindobonensis TaxID=195748 RepID=A0ABW5VUI3_9MICO
MSTTCYVLDGKHLKVVDGDKFVNEGVPVHRIVLPNGDVHLVERREIQVSGQKDGVLELSNGGEWLRAYGSWVYVDGVPYSRTGSFTV